ncbi:hypothetical protein MmiEs2_15500 [Methanimicrococcus stummii]|uniref:Uncharacterized protein n=1 Tax=Methanimicrococcus stummii TaxID=3028294 RepID=A0AA96VAM7_9EURY|nr:hypothetical protein [Methanimicrococcus sp. Es2]WNY29323.1 hypothetical protein MmiEs2_15500 [Methanimicrococcus sp. Es2]
MVSKIIELKNKIGTHIECHRLFYILLLIVGYILLMWTIEKYASNTFLQLVDFFSFIENNDLLKYSLALFALLLIYLVFPLMVGGFVFWSILRKWDPVTFFSNHVKLSMATVLILFVLSFYSLNKMIVSWSDLASLVLYMYIFSIIAVISSILIGTFHIKEKELNRFEKIFNPESLNSFFIIFMSFVNLIFLFFGMIFYIYVYLFESNGIEFVDFGSLISYVTVLVTVMYVFYTMKMFQTSQNALKTTKTQTSIQENEIQIHNIHSDINFHKERLNSYYSALYSEFVKLNESFENEKKLTPEISTHLKSILKRYQQNKYLEYGLKLNINTFYEEINDDFKNLDFLLNLKNLLKNYGGKAFIDGQHYDHLISKTDLETVIQTYKNGFQYNNTQLYSLIKNQANTSISSDDIFSSTDLMETLSQIKDDQYVFYSEVCTYYEKQIDDLTLNIDNKISDVMNKIDESIDSVNEIIQTKLDKLDELKTVTFEEK